MVRKGLKLSDKNKRGVVEREQETIMKRVNKYLASE